MRIKTRLMPFIVLTLTVCIAGCADDTPIETDNDDGDGGDGSAIVVSSVSATRGQQGVTIPVLMTNDIAVRGILLPLVLRSIDAGAYVTSLKLTFGDRLPPDGLLSDVKFTNQYGSEDGTCKTNQPGGFGTISFRDTLAHAVGGSPVGVFFTRQRIIADDLPPGTDNTGSFLLTVDVTNVAGRFEIDSTCTNPSNHLLFVTPEIKGVVPSFTKGTITIE